MENTSGSVRELELGECWTLLESRDFGRLAYSVGTHPEIVPINYCVSDRAIYFRTAGGGKLFGVTVNQNVAFEIDDIVGEVARSVIVTGTATRLDHQAEIDKAEELPLRPWIPADKYNYVRIDVDDVSGRELHMGAEPCD
ncbi:pyridoxamine 5'-phosphate oxidase family protein [Mobilicoccus sp.]|uniref:pyridoxamine 5'-phosphate oxidase family protein n=1 Tax=Mobilicoccus sp. TaxID=2034349 RepID=UPI00289F9430|nr:pyridoxamine 5'-phosphate oxidase family protein [Mobilicoccus sp.]